MNETIQQVLAQETIEERHNRKHIDKKIRDAIEDNDMLKPKLEHAENLVEEYLAKAGTYYGSKQKRVQQLDSMNIQDLVMDIHVGIAYFQLPELFTSATAQIAARLKFSDKIEAITTVAELLGVLCGADLFDIIKENKTDSLKLVSKIPLGDALIKFIDRSSFLPPMVCSPLELVHNYSSGYLTHNDSLILGTGNHHDGDLCLDVLNLMNAVPLKLDTEFLSKVEEEPTFELETQEQIEQWLAFKRQSYYFYTLLVQNGNRLWFNHKVDKRGRIYSHGYHLNPQGTAFKKAMLEFADERIVEGVPT